MVGDQLQLCLNVDVDGPPREVDREPGGETREGLQLLWEFGLNAVGAKELAAGEVDDPPLVIVTAFVE